MRLLSKEGGLCFLWRLFSLGGGEAGKHPIVGGGWVGGGMGGGGVSCEEFGVDIGGGGGIGPLDPPPVHKNMRHLRGQTAHTTSLMRHQTSDLIHIADEASLVLHFLQHAHSAHVYPPKSVAIVTTHYAHMLWLQHCLWEAGHRLHGNQAYECVQTIATLDRYQGLQAPVVLASLVSSEPGIMKDVVRANTLTSRAQSEVHLFGPFFGWDQSPLTVGWLSGLRVMADELRQSPSQEDVQRVRLPGVLYQHPALAQPEVGVIYKFKGGGVGGGGAVALETVEEACKSL